MIETCVYSALGRAIVARATALRLVQAGNDCGAPVTFLHADITKDPATKDTFGVSGCAAKLHSVSSVRLTSVTVASVLNFGLFDLRRVKF